MWILIGLDSIDSYLGGCTTHFATYVVEEIFNLNGLITDYPRLIRLNPDIPWKTRGNGSVAIEAIIANKNVKKLVQNIKEKLYWYIDKIGGHYINSDPCIIFINGNKLTDTELELLNRFSINALYKLIKIDEILEIKNIIKDKIIAEIKPFGNKGLIGAISAIGNFIYNDYTFELLIYRNLMERYRNRDINLNNIRKKINKFLNEDTFAHIDFETNRLLWMPHGPDPVIAGIRSNNISSLMGIFRRIIDNIKYDRWMIFITNQGTNQHLENSNIKNNLYSIKIYNEVKIRAKISKNIVNLKGGHIFLKSFSNNTQFIIAGYYETGRMREVLKSIREEIIVGGGIKPNKLGGPPILNLQFIILKRPYFLKNIKVNIFCPKCYKKMDNKGKGYKCNQCNYKITFNKYKVKPLIINNIPTPQIYLPPYRSIFHISKPLKRYGREKKYRIKGLKNLLIFYTK